MLKKISEKIKNIPRFWWVLTAILIAGIFLRTWNHHEWLRFNADQGRDATVVSDVIDGKSSWPLLGPKAGGTQFRLGPAFYYFEIASAKMFGNYPEKMAYPDLLTSILTIPLIFLFLRKYFEKNISLALTAIFAVSAYAVFYSRFAWNPNSMPFWTLLALYSIHEALSTKENAKRFWASLAGAAIGIAVQLHTTLLVILPVATVAIFAFKSAKNRKYIRYFVFLLIFALLVNIPQIVSEIQTKGDNTKAFFKGLDKKNDAEKNLIDNTVHATSCWIQGNTYIISGYEISDTCSFTPGKNTADTSSFFLGLIFVLGGTVLFVRNYLRETDPDRKSFLGIVLAFTAVTFLVFLKMAFELSVRFYLPLIFLPFLLLGFWIQFLGQGSKVHRTTVLIAAVSLFFISNILFVQKYFVGLSKYEKERGGNTNVVILRQAEVFSDFIVANSQNVKEILIEGNNKFLFKGYKPIRYLVGRSNISLSLVDEKSPPSGKYFYVASLKKKEKLLKDKNIQVFGYVTYGNFAIMLLQNNENK